MQPNKIWRNNGKYFLKLTRKTLRIEWKKSMGNTKSCIEEAQRTNYHQMINRKTNRKTNRKSWRHPGKNAYYTQLTSHQK